MDNNYCTPGMHTGERTDWGWDCCGAPCPPPSQPLPTLADEIRQFKADCDRLMQSEDEAGATE